MLSSIGIAGLVMLLIPIAIFIAIIFFIVKIVKGFEQRSTEKLALEREQTAILKQKMTDLDGRVTAIENVLKEVE